MFGKKTKKLQRTVTELQCDVCSLQASNKKLSRRISHIAEMQHIQALTSGSSLEARYAALLEKLGLEEVEIKAGIKLVEKQPFGKTCEHGIPIELCSAAHAQEPPP